MANISFKAVKNAQLDATTKVVGQMIFTEDNIIIDVSNNKRIKYIKSLEAGDGIELDTTTNPDKITIKSTGIAGIEFVGIDTLA